MDIKNRYKVLGFLNSESDALSEKERKDLFDVYYTSKERGGGYEGMMRVLKEKREYGDFMRKVNEFWKEKISDEKQ